MEKVWEIKNPESYLHPKKRKKRGPSLSEKNPARAYTLSLLFWGSGQSYNDEYGKALTVQLLLIVCIVSAAVAVLLRSRLLPFLQHEHLLSHSFLFAEILLVVLLVLWVGLAGDAYRTAARSRSRPFSGVQSRVVPSLCSLMLPGWGQFMNGQPLKGAFISACAALGIFSFVSIPAVLLAWPFLEPDSSRAVIEDIFVISVLAAPLMPILWLFSIHDALLVSLDEYRKEPLWERIKAANNRRRTQGLVQGVVPWIGRALLLAAVLTICVIVLSRTSPAGYYGQRLSSAGRDLTGMGMTILPEMITRVVDMLPGR